MKKTLFYFSRTIHTRFSIVLFLTFFSISALSAQVGIGTENPEASSIFDVTSTSKGFLVPRMTESQKNSISSPAQGLLVFQTNGTIGFYSYDGSNWLHLIHGSSQGLYFGPGTGNGDNNLAVGTSLGSGTGKRNTAIGSRALESYSGTSFDNNTAVGYYALQKVTTGQQNTGLGAEVMFELTSGSHNTAIGAQTIINSTGSGNTALGYRAGETLTTGSNNILIGKNANVSSNNLSNATVIGANAIVNASNKIRLGDTNVTNIETSGTITAGAITIPNTDGSANQVLKTDGSGSLSWTTMSSSSGGGIIAPEEAFSVTLSDSDHGKIFFSQHSNRPVFPDPDTLSAGFTCTIVNYSNYDGTMTSPSTTIIGTRSNSMYPAKDHAGVQQSVHASNVGGKGFPVSNIGFSSGGTIQIRVITISSSNYYYVTGDFYYK